MDRLLTHLPLTTASRLYRITTSIRLLLTKVCLLLMLAVPLSAQAQDLQTWEQMLNRYAQQEDMESERWELTYDLLSELAAHPLSLNRCSRQDLEQLPFLSEQQVMDIIEYRDRYEQFRSALELRLVPSLSREEADLLLQFVTIEETDRQAGVAPLGSLLDHARHELTAAAKLPLYDRKGDRNGYLGYKYKHWMRYMLSAKHLRAGLVGSQDAGEPFMAGRNKAGYDYYSAFAELRDMGRLKQMMVGRYRMRTAMGLVVNNSFGLGKINMLTTLGRSGTHLTAHSSRSEANYLQGAAATVALGRHLDLTAFASWRKIDATLNSDSQTVATILTSGYHRTESEMARRRNTSQTALGANLYWASNGFHLGATAVYTGFDRELKPLSGEFRRWNAEGKQFWNASMDYGYRSGRLTIQGETATGTRGTVATINTLSLRLGSAWQLMALQRYYPYQFVSVMGETFAEGGQVQNESGMYVGAQWQPLKGMRVMAYADMAYFAWPKYQAASSSHCFDQMLQVERQLDRWSWMARYRLKLREYDNAEKTALEYRQQHRGRLSLGYAAGGWTLRTQADMSYSCAADNQLGYMIGEHLGYAGQRWQLRFSAGYFHTDGYAARVYAYEPGLLYTFSFPAFYGEGVRTALSAKAQLCSWLLVVAKVGSTLYTHRTTIGSGLSEIADARSLTDVELQFKLRI